jgi:group II intron reverse transcriptase/maturase
MLSKGYPVNPGDLTTSSEGWAKVPPITNRTGSSGDEGKPDRSERPLTEDTRVQAKAEDTAKGSREVLRTHSTDEGGELQGSRKGAATVSTGGKGETAGRSGSMAHQRDIELGEGCSTPLSRLTELAQEDAARKFYSIAHFLTRQALYEAFRHLRKDASAGVDKVTYRDYQKELGRNLQNLWEKAKSGQYRALPLRRIYIPKDDGKQRPISIPALEDKIVQAATVRLLNAIYEVDFLPCSFGSRPGGDPHKALDEIDRIIFREPITHILELDITSYFDSIVRKHLVEMLEQRVTDRSILRLIGKWINVGVIDEGRLLKTEEGVGQGQVISPFLANVYLHYVLDKWFEEEVKPRLKGKAYLVRYVDDAVICFEKEEDAKRVHEVLGKRFAKYGLTLHPHKTRLVEFGRKALEKAEREGKPPETFDFLGYTHVSTRSRRGKFTMSVRTMKKRFRRSLKKVTAWCKEHRHEPVVKQCAVLNDKLRSHYQYYGRASNYPKLERYLHEVKKVWRKWLSRRTRGKPMSWKVFEQLLKRHPLELPRITHAYASLRSPK